MRNDAFRAYLEQWCASYAVSLARVPLFSLKRVLSEREQRRYAAAFQTFRGHFIETVMLPMHRLARDASVPPQYRKRIVEGLRKPMEDELGLVDSCAPHDQLYKQFAVALGVDADAALWDLKCQPQAIAAYNKALHGYVTSCLGSGWSSVLRGLTVYLLLERIDEFDYSTQLRFVSRFSLLSELSQPDRTLALQFFSVHALVGDEHFEAMPGILDEQWPEQQSAIRLAGDFLLNLHCGMYDGLSKFVLGQMDATPVVPESAVYLG